MLTSTAQNIETLVRLSYVLKNHESRAYAENALRLAQRSYHKPNSFTNYMQNLHNVL
jgi:hypothetical protein